MAEREGFEPPDPYGSTVFKTAAFDRSATSPGWSKSIPEDLQLFPQIQVKTNVNSGAASVYIGFSSRLLVHSAPLDSF
jgi:hypothetical protein